MNATNMTSRAGVEHLSEDQIDDELLGDLQDAAAAHLAECHICTQRVAEAREPIASFKDMTIAWSERRSATMPLPVVPAQGAWWQRRAGWAMASVALAFGIAVAGPGNTAAMFQTQVQPEQAASVATEEIAGAKPVAVAAVYDPPAERVSADNTMLKAIDSELNASVASPATLGLEPGVEQAATDDGQSLLEH